MKTLTNKESIMNEPAMKILTGKKSIIGEGPIWNEHESKLYVTNGIEKEILIYDIFNNTSEIRKTAVSCAAICFSSDNKPIVSHPDGVGTLESDGTVTAIYDTDKYRITAANDMKVGPDGRIYVGTQCGKRLGISNKIDGKLYSVDKYGKVSTLLDGLILSNGLDWSPDGKTFYHTDSDTEIIKEYRFDKTFGKISYTGRQVRVSGVDGLCVAENGDIYAACWGRGCIAVIDTARFTVKRTIAVPADIPASCAFVGKNAEYLAITTATFDTNGQNKNDGLVFLCDVGVKGKLPYKFPNIRS